MLSFAHLEHDVPFFILVLIVFFFFKQKFCRTDFEITNGRGQRIQCSHWEPVNRAFDQLPCVVYLHGNSSNRMECIEELPVVLGIGATMFSFDFTGSGNSDGDFVSLGHYEKDDLLAVLDYLHNLKTISGIALWGRSMGAVTALMHASRDPMIQAMILDSAFTDLAKVTEELIDRGREAGAIMPKFVEFLLFQMVRQSVQKAASFDIEQLRPIDDLKNCMIPAIFLAGDLDTLISPTHSQILFQNYPHPEKHLIIIQNGDHNSSRTHDFKIFAQRFLKKHFNIPEDRILTKRGYYFNSIPPWGQTMQYPVIDVGMTQEQQENLHNAMGSFVGKSMRPT